MRKENINKRLLKEIAGIDAKKNLKELLEELLLKENSGILKHAYKEEYKRLISKYISKK